MENSFLELTHTYDCIISWAKLLLKNHLKEEKEKERKRILKKKHLYVNKFYYLITRGYHQNVGLHTYEI